jgi:heat-inducible transcriptional repressor
VADDRRLEVLRAIVEDFVTTREPVGSKSLVERHALGVSPATIRNDMAVLEEQGYITQPHTSAGRIPTDKGYRLFVDRLSEVRPMTAPERRAIRAFLDGAVGLDDVVDRTVRLLSQITRQTAVVQYPSSSRSSVRHVDLVPLPPERVLLVLIVSNGRVEQRLVEAPGHDGGTLEELRNRINASVVGKRLDVASSDVRTLLDLPPYAPGSGDERAAATAGSVVAALADLLRSEREERIVVAGTSHLVRRGTEFPGELSTVLEAPGGAGRPAPPHARHGRGAGRRVRADRPRDRAREPRPDRRRHQRVRLGRRGRPARRARADAHGLPDHHRRRTGRGPLRLSGPRAVSPLAAAPHPPTEGTLSL